MNTSTRSTRRMLLAATCAAALGVFACAPPLLASNAPPAEAPEANVDPAVESGRKAIDHWIDYPWYDETTDGIRRFNVYPPRQPWNWSFPFELAMQIFFWAIGAAFLIVLAIVLWRAFRNRETSTWRASRPKVDTSDHARIQSLPFPVAAGRLDLLSQARRHYDAGDFAKAIVFLYSYQLVFLDRHQIIHLTKGKTNRQYLREVGSGTTLRRLVEDTMIAFEDVFFGHHAIDRGTFESRWSRVDEFQALATAAAPPAAE